MLSPPDKRIRDVEQSHINMPCREVELERTLSQNTSALSTDDEGSAQGDIANDTSSEQSSDFDEDLSFSDSYIERNYRCDQSNRTTATSTGSQSSLLDHMMDDDSSFSPSCAWQERSDEAKSLIDEVRRKRRRGTTRVRFAAAQGLSTIHLVSSGKELEAPQGDPQHLIRETAEQPELDGETAGADDSSSICLLDQVSGRTLVRCNLVLTRLCCSCRKPINNQMIDQMLKQLDKLYDITLPNSIRSSNTLRGLESSICPVPFETFQERHIANVLGAQHECRQSEPSPAKRQANSCTSSSRLQKASLRTSRPLRHLAFQIAKYDAKQAAKIYQTD